VFTLQGLPYFGSKDDREGAHRNKKRGVFCRRPVLLGVPSAGADQQMNMRMVKQSASPPQGEQRPASNQVSFSRHNIKLATFSPAVFGVRHIFFTSSHCTWLQTAG
jgi:hypothetical protein